MSGAPQLTQEQLDRIARNRAQALERKRKAEEGAGAGASDANKRLSSAATPSFSRGAGWGGDAGLHRAPDLEEPCAQGHAAWRPAALPRPSAEAWASATHDCRLAAAPAPSVLPSEFQRAGKEEAQASPLAPSARGNRPSAESWAAEGTHQGDWNAPAVGWNWGKQRAGPAACLSQSTLSFGGGGGLALALAKPSGVKAQPHQMPAALRKGHTGGGAGGAASKKPEDDDAFLSQEQKMVKEKVMAGANIFLTGGAGTGKSFLVQNLILALKRHRGREAVAM